MNRDLIYIQTSSDNPIVWIAEYNPIPSHNLLTESYSWGLWSHKTITSIKSWLIILTQLKAGAPLNALKCFRLRHGEVTNYPNILIIHYQFIDYDMIIRNKWNHFKSKNSTPVTTRLQKGLPIKTPLLLFWAYRITKREHTNRNNLTALGEHRLAKGTLCF